jgi:hypothetical protein
MMRDLTDRAYLREEQYRDGRNLDARVRLHQLFSVTRGSLNRWLFEHILVDPTSRGAWSAPTCRQGWPPRPGAS